MEQRFLDLMEIILRKLLGIKKSRYKKGLRDTYGGPITAGNFYSLHVINPIKAYNGDGEGPLSEDAISKIDESIRYYFDEDLFRYSRVNTVFDTLEEKGYINIDPIEGKDSFNKKAAAEMIVYLWHYYYEGFCKGEDLPACNVDKYIQDLEKTNLIAKLEVDDYEEALKIVDRIRLGDMKNEPETVDLIYRIFIEKFIDSNMASLTKAEFDAFIDLVYYLSDIFDFTNDVRSYNLQAIALNSMNGFYEDDFSDADQDTLRRLIGFIYGITIAVKNSNTESNYFIRLSKNNNIVTTKEKKYEDKQDEEKEKLKICYDAMKSIAESHFLRNTKVGENNRINFLETKQNHLKNGQYSKTYFSDDIVSKMEIAALWASDMAAIQKVRNEKGDDKNDCNLRNANSLHKYCGEMRKLLIDFYKKRLAKTKDKKEKDYYRKKIKIVERRYAKTLSNLVGIKEVEKDYIDAIVDRSILHKYFKTIEATSLADAERDHLKLAISNFKTYKLNECKCGMDYNMAFIALLNDKELMKIYPNLSKTETRIVTSARDSLLKKSKVRLSEKEYYNYIRALEKVFPSSNASCLEEEIELVFKRMIAEKNYKKGEALSSYYFIDDKDNFSAVLKNELISNYFNEKQAEKSEKIYENA